MKKRFLKFLIIPAIFAVLISLSLASCEDDKDTTTPPEISNFLAGTHPPDVSDTIVKKPGAEIIVDFNAESKNDGTLEAYHIKIHDHDEYKIINELFDDEPTFKGLRNAHVHKHIAIPDEAPLGEYHVEVIVFDEFENTSEVDTHIYLVEEE